MTSPPRPRPLDLRLEHLTKPLLWYYGTNLATETPTTVIIRGIKERMTTKIINLLEKQATISHTQPTAGYKAVKMIPSDKNTVFLSRHEASHHSVPSGGRDSPPSVYLSRRPRRPTCCRWISRRSPLIRLESFGSSQPSVKACLHAAGCFLQELIPTAAGPTSHHTHVVCRDKHLTLATRVVSVRD